MHSPLGLALSLYVVQLRDNNMPSKSHQQYKFFKAMQENPELAKEKGISPQVAQDYTQGMTKRKWKALQPKVKQKEKK